VNSGQTLQWRQKKDKRTNNDIQKTLQRPNDPANPTKNWG
jgi:hypothetical protein